MARNRTLSKKEDGEKETSARPAKTPANAGRAKKGWDAISAFPMEYEKRSGESFWGDIRRAFNGGSSRQ